MTPATLHTRLAAWDMQPSLSGRRMRAVAPDESVCSRRWHDATDGTARRLLGDEGTSVNTAARSGTCSDGADMLPFLRAAEGTGDGTAGGAWPADAEHDEHDCSEVDAAADVVPCEADRPTPRRLRLVVADDDATLTALIHRIVDRDQRALEALYDATSARVHGLVLRIVQRPALAEEVLEDTFWQVWRQAPRFDAARGRPVTWLLAMARSRAIDALRRDERFRHDALPEEDLLDADGSAPPLQDLLDAARGAEHLHAALSELDARARQLISLAFFRGLTHEEIAGQEHMPLGSVKSVIRRSLQQLRRSLERGVA